MATEAHCIYCFETLSARLEHYTPLSLSQVEESWNQYLASESEERPEESEKLSNGKIPEEIRHSSGNTPSSSTPSVNSTASSLAAANLLSRSSLSSSSSAPIAGKSKSPKYPLFVTWNTISDSGSKSLRGCIGTFEDHQLEHGLNKFALIAALEDSRFSSIGVRELTSLECAVTLLTDFEPAPDPMGWEIGKHGIRISFTHNSRRYGSTYLPDVAKEQGWTKTEALISLMHKAGWRGRDEEWYTVKDLNVVRYQGLAMHVGYSDFREWKDWLAERK